MVSKNFVFESRRLRLLW